MRTALLQLTSSDDPLENLKITSELVRSAANELRSRTTHGHSLAISPWGEVLLDARQDFGVHIVDVELSGVAKARNKIPSLQHDKGFTGP